MAKKILALVAEPISADTLRSAVGEEEAKERFDTPVRHMLVE